MDQTLIGYDKLSSISNIIHHYFTYADYRMVQNLQNMQMSACQWDKFPAALAVQISNFPSWHAHILIPYKLFVTLLIELGKGR